MKQGIELEWTKKTLEDALTDSELYRKVRKKGQKDAEAAIGTFSGLKDAAALGDREARREIVGYFMDVISFQAGNNRDRIIEGMVNFDNIEDNPADVLFEMLIDGESFGEILAKYGKESVFDIESLRMACEEENRSGMIAAKYVDRNERLRFVAERMYAFMYGQDCIDSLQYQDINEIGILNKDYIYVIFRGKKIRLPFLKISETGVIINIQKKTTQNSAMNFDRQNPVLVTAKNNSSRIAVAAFDVTPFESDVYYNERIFNLNVITLEEMRDNYHTIDDSIYKLLCMNQKGRGSFLVTGSDMGVGKSTFLLAMMEKYPDYWGIGILDAQNEIQAGVKYPEKNVITLVENSKKTLSQCFAYLLKTSRDIIVVGEITLPEEVSEMINAAMRLNAGVCGTMHSLSPAEVIPNLRNLMLRTEMYGSKETAEEDAAGALDLIIHLRRLKNGRIVTESINEVVRLGKDEKGIYEIRRLLHFDTEKDNWVKERTPSERYFEKMERYVEKYQSEEVRKMFSDTEEESLRK